MEQRNEAASNHASLLTCSFLFRALARLQPPAGLIETAMEREIYIIFIYMIYVYNIPDAQRLVYLPTFITVKYTNAGKVNRPCCWSVWEKTVNSRNT